MSDISEEDGEELSRGERRKFDSYDFEGDDRRRALRVKGIVVEYTVQQFGKSELKSAFLRDLSLDGLSISVTEQIMLGAMLDLNIYLSGSDIPIQVEAEVRWIKISEYFLEVKKEHYDVGLKMMPLDEKDAKKLARYIKRH